MTRRRLPHIYPEGAALFATFHLHGSLPHHLSPPAPLKSGEAFVWLDRQIDNPRSGPLFLKRPEIAQIVVESIQRGAELGHYQLAAYIVMANHVHLLIRPLIDPSRRLRSLKGASAREANIALGRTGQPFWQKESYDHWVRNDDEFFRIRAYIENNPVKAGLVRTPAEFRWSSACIETSLDAARTSACATSG
ncbi:MAG TPA: transposase [Bryobacteraceae bacterium]|nr:transposase [Bryobacteraceae bacterium]